MMTEQYWIELAPPSTSPLRLFCFPYAGGGASVYRSWRAHLPREIELCPVHLPGREARHRERPYESLDALVIAIADALPPWLDRPYAFFGHSMGALVAFELARELRRRGAPAPLHLFVSGITPPQARVSTTARHRLSDHDLLDELRRFGGTPERLLEEPEIVRLLLPVLRADLAAVETYQPRAEQPLAIPIAGFAGAWDPEASPEAMAGWRSQTGAGFELTTFPGNHFFLHGDVVRRALLDRVMRTLFESLGHAA